MRRQSSLEEVISKLSSQEPMCSVTMENKLLELNGEKASQVTEAEEAKSKTGV